MKITYSDGSVVRFGYDGLGRRVFRQEGSNVRYFYYDGDRIIAEREGNAWVVRYLLGLRPSGFMANGQVRVYHADRLGSVRWVTDGSQNILVSYVYEGFGKIVGQNGGGGGPYQFCGLWGYRNDQDAGLMHVGARYYEVETGRFIQLDRLGTDLNHSDYTYCSNQPTLKVDPSGHVAFPTKKFVIEIVNPILRSYLPEMPYPLPPWKPPGWLQPDYPYVRILPRPPYPISVPLPFQVATNAFKVIAEWGAETFWGPPNGPRPNESITISPLEALVAKRSGLTLNDLGF